MNVGLLREKACLNLGTLNKNTAKKNEHASLHGQKSNSPCFTGKNSILLKMMINDAKGITNTLKAEVAENFMEMMPTGILNAKGQVSKYAGEMADSLSMAKVNANYNVLRLGFAAAGVIFSSQLKTACRIGQNLLIDPLHLERAKEFLEEGLKLHPGTHLMGDVKDIVEKLKPKEDIVNTLSSKMEKFATGYEKIMDKLIDPKSVKKDIEPGIALTKEALLRFERFVDRVDKKAALCVVNGKKPTTPTGEHITTRIFNSLIEGGAGLKSKTFNPWRIFPLDSDVPISFIKGKSSISMPESFINEMKAKGLTEEMGLKAVWNRYIAEHPDRVLEKVKELKETSDSSFKLVTSKMRKATSGPQELIKL